jgi:hypothetical protein
MSLFGGERRDEGLDGDVADRSGVAVAGLVVSATASSENSGSDRPARGAVVTQGAGGLLAGSWVAWHSAAQVNNQPRLTPHGEEVKIPHFYL